MTQVRFHLDAVLTIFTLLAALAVGLMPSQAYANDGFVTDATASQAGLKVEWFSQVGVGAAGSLVDWQLNVDENQSTTYFVVESGRRREVVSQDDLDAFGNAFGIEKAEAFAKERKAFLEYEHKVRGREIEVKISSFTLPKSTLYVLSSDGMLTALDADTGKNRWSQLVGDPYLPSVGLGASKQYVAVVNGSRVYCLDAETGRILWDRKCKYAVGSSPACSDKFVFVPLANGRLESFPIESRGVGSVAFVAMGQGTARPLVTENTVSWPTIAGHLNVAPKESRKTVSYRLKADDAIVSSPTSKDGMLFATSLDGFVYGLDEEKGRLLWEVSTGDGISASAVPYGKYLYVVSDGESLYKIEAKTGQYAKGWERPMTGITQFVGVAKDQFYCLDSNGKLIGIDKSSGSITSSLETGYIEMVLPNHETDRMYFANKSGYIQCVRQLASLRPRLIGGDVDEELSGPEPDEGNSVDPGNPFGEGAEENPFGDSATESADEENPFGGDDENPFGGGSDEPKAEDENPFGGGSDDDENPFG